MPKTCSCCKESKPVAEFYRRGNGRRGQCIACMRSRHGSTSKTVAGGGRLPVGPFRRWMEERLDYYGSLELLSKATGMSDRQVRRVLRESEMVALDTVDRALINEGSTPLWALEYSEGEFQQAAHEASRARGRK